MNVLNSLAASVTSSHRLHPLQVCISEADLSSLAPGSTKSMQNEKHVAVKGPIFGYRRKVLGLLCRTAEERTLNHSSHLELYFRRIFLWPTATTFSEQVYHGSVLLFRFYCCEAFGYCSLESLSLWRSMNLDCAHVGGSLVSLPIDRQVLLQFVESVIHIHSFLNPQIPALRRCSLPITNSKHSYYRSPIPVPSWTLQNTGIARYYVERAESDQATHDWEACRWLKGGGKAARNAILKKGTR